MDKAVYILKNVYHLYQLAGRILSREGKFLAVPFDGFLDEDPVFNSPRLLQMLMEYGREQKKYKVWNDGGYWYYVFHNLGDYIIWGPVNSEENMNWKMRSATKNIFHLPEKIRCGNGL